MTFILVPKHGEDVQINGWNWHPTLALLHAENLISDEQYERMGAQGVSGKVDAELADRIADVVERELILMRTSERMRADLTVTAEPKKRWSSDMKPDEVDVNEIYSATYEWLVEFAAFCRSSGGFEVC
jgi:hypothetical protein